MLKPENLHLWSPAFAYLQDNADRGATLTDYKRWVSRVAKNEFADELVLAATAKCLDLDVVVLTYTPAGSDSQWVPWRSQVEVANAEQMRILLGNDDVHYVLIHSKETE